MRKMLAVAFLTLLIWWAAFFVYAKKVVEIRKFNFEISEMEMAQSRVAILAVVDQSTYALDAMCFGRPAECEDYWLADYQSSSLSPALTTLAGPPPPQAVQDELGKLLVDQNVKLGSKSFMLGHDHKTVIAFAKTPSGYKLLGRIISADGLIGRLYNLGLMIAAFGGFFSLLAAFFLAKFVFKVDQISGNPIEKI